MAAIAAALERSEPQQQEHKVFRAEDVDKIRPLTREEIDEAEARFRETTPAAKEPPEQ
ncbi:hypothetical protein [Alistipes sp.]